MAGLLGRMDEHGRVEALLSPYLDGLTSAAERALVERHIESCGDCARNLETLRATVMAIREMPPVRAPRSFALPRSMAHPVRAAAWPYPFLRAATGVAAFLFALVLSVDLLAPRMLVPASAPLAGSPAALAPTVVAMESANQATAPAATGHIETLAATAAPQFPAPFMPTPGVQTRQDKSAPPSTSAPSAFGAAPAPVAATPALAATSALAAQAAESAMPVTPPVERPLAGSGAGGGGADNGLGGGGQAPGPLPAAPLPPPRPGGPAADARSTPAQPAAAPTEVARAAAPQPPPAEPRGGAFQPQSPALDPVRIAEGGLAALAVAFGVAAWIARRRGR